MTLLAPQSICVITTCSSQRRVHLDHQIAALRVRRQDLRHLVVWLDDSPPADIPGSTVLAVPPGRHGFRLSAARNSGAAEALAGGARLLIFLDADCVPGPNLIDRYVHTAQLMPDAVLCGPVTYLPEGYPMSAEADLTGATAPHPGRPSPAAGQIRAATPEEYALFWSLSFAVTDQTWLATGGFDEAYQGYGAEDTDFAWRLQEREIQMSWVGGADAYHQYHPTSTPPWHNLEDIVRNANLFRQRWGQWPMRGWLDAFESAGAIAEVAGRYQLTDVADRRSPL